MIDGEHHPYGGACRCGRCRNKTPRDGVYRASPVEYAAAEAIRQRIKDADDYAMEMMPQRLPGEGRVEYRERILTRRSAANAFARDATPDGGGAG
jgi:hypothetical protein